MQILPWAKLAGKALASNVEGLIKPYKLTYVVTKECHSRCLHCDIWRVKPKNELTLDEIQRFAKNSPFLSWIDFTGGEPTDRPDFVEVVGTFLNECPDMLLVHFPTNGLKPRRISNVAEQISKHKPGKLVVTVSIDGPPELNDELRGIRGDFRQATETYRRLSEIEGVEVYVGMTLFDKNVSMIDATVEALCQEIPGFTHRNLHVNLPNVSEHYYENESSAPRATREMVDAMLDFMRKRGTPLKPLDWIERAYHKRARRYIESAECPQTCAALKSSCFLSQDGTLFPCTIWNEPIGNIRESGYSLLPLLNSDRTRDLRRRLINKDCPNCWTPCEAYQTIFANFFRTN